MISCREAILPRSDHAYFVKKIEDVIDCRGFNFQFEKESVYTPLFLFLVFSLLSVLKKPRYNSKRKRRVGWQQGRER